jgi:hypothetical protein
MHLEVADVIAQSGRYPPNANSLAGFIVEGEQRVLGAPTFAEAVAR